ncbi:hypothetical protein L2E82_08272 [Cichorium intybus]|uniref:Uncharacterized protein n=1 Tax=Cichorium intybus TaxID=13427 RepID=A0ACB9G606_CICIN|nr:hypothetical protein L2E82_08272 [Cichorium intybus]
MVKVIVEGNVFQVRAKEIAELIHARDNGEGEEEGFVQVESWDEKEEFGGEQEFDEKEKLPVFEEAVEIDMDDTFGLNN